MLAKKNIVIIITSGLDYNIGTFKKHNLLEIYVQKTLSATLKALVISIPRSQGQLSPVSKCFGFGLVLEARSLLETKNMARFSGKVIEMSHPLPDYSQIQKFTVNNFC